MEIYNKIPHSEYYMEMFSKDIVLKDRVIYPGDLKGEVTIDIANKKVTNTLDWFLLLSIFKPELPSEFIDRYDNIDFVKCRQVMRKSMEIPYTVIFKEPLSIEFKGEEFRLIPRFPLWAIDKHGNLLNMTTKKIQVCVLGGNRDYIYYYLRDPMLTNHRIVVSMHRLLAMAWIPNDDWENKIVVDHIDGDKFNNSINNLQWVTPSENVRRAAILRGEEKYFCRKVNDDVIHIFPSIEKCSEFIGRSKIILSLTPIRPGRIWEGKNGSFYLATSPEDLNRRFQEDCSKNLTEVRRSPIEAYNIYSKDYLRFEDVSSLCRDLSLGRVKVMNRLYNKELRKCPIDGWLIRPESKEEWNVDDVKDKPCSPKTCFVKDMSSGIEREFSSIKGAGRFLRTTNHVINKHMKTGKPFERNGIKYKITGPVDL